MTLIELKEKLERLNDLSSHFKYLEKWIESKPKSFRKFVLDGIDGWHRYNVDTDVNVLLIKESCQDLEFQKKAKNLGINSI